MDKILTIVIPAYNVEKYIEKCLDSFIAESVLDDIEVLIVNDGSKDSTADKAKKYEIKYPNTFRVIDKENGGHGSTINRGIKEARGKYFKVVDGDDWVNTEEFPDFIETLKKVDSDIVASNYYCIEDKTEKILEKRYSALDTNHYGRTWKFIEAVREPIIKIHSLTVRTSILKENNVEVDEHCFYEDAEYILYPIPYCTNVYYDNHFIYMYRLGRNGQSVDIKSMQKRRGEHEKVLNSLFAFSQKNSDIDVYKKRYIDTGIALSAQNQFQIYLSMGNKNGIKQEMIDFDKKMKENYPGVYNAVTKKSIWALRKSDYKIFWLGSLIYRILK